MGAFRKLLLRCHTGRLPRQSMIVSTDITEIHDTPHRCACKACTSPQSWAWNKLESKSRSAPPELRRSAAQRCSTTPFDVRHRQLPLGQRAALRNLEHIAYLARCSNGHIAFSHKKQKLQNSHLCTKGMSRKVKFLGEDRQATEFPLLTAGLIQDRDALLERLATKLRELPKPGWAFASQPPRRPTRTAVARYRSGHRMP